MLAPALEKRATDPHPTRHVERRECSIACGLLYPEVASTLEAHQGPSAWIWPIDPIKSANSTYLVTPCQGSQTPEIELWNRYRSSYRPAWPAILPTGSINREKVCPELYMKLRADRFFEGQPSAVLRACLIASATSSAPISTLSPLSTSNSFMRRRRRSVW